MSIEISNLPSFNGQGCEICGHPNLLPHELGWVCEVCGTVQEEDVFEQKQPIIKSRETAPVFYHSPKGFGTTIGNKSERREPVFQRIDRLNKDRRTDVNLTVRHYFQHFAAVLDLKIPMDDLMLIFNKIFPQLPYGSHVRSLEYLSFAILLRIMQNRGNCLTVKKACVLCSINPKKLRKIFWALNRTSLRDEMKVDGVKLALHYLAKVQDRYNFQPEDIGHITKILNSSASQLGSHPNVQAAKAVVIYMKAQYFTRFFRRLQTTHIYDWIDLFQHLSLSGWSNRLAKGLGKTDLQVVAHDFGISYSEAYRAFTQLTWLKDHVVKNGEDEIVKVAWLRIPEWCFDGFFQIQAQNPKRNSNAEVKRFKFETYSPFRKNLSVEMEKIKKIQQKKKETQVANSKIQVNQNTSAVEKVKSPHRRTKHPEEPYQNQNRPGKEIEVLVYAVSIPQAMANMNAVNPYRSMDDIPPPSLCYDALAGVGPP